MTAMRTKKTAVEIAELIKKLPDMAGDRVSIPEKLRSLPRADQRVPDKYDRLYWGKVREGKIG